MENDSWNGSHKSLLTDRFSDTKLTQMYMKWMAIPGPIPTGRCL